MSNECVLSSLEKRARDLLYRVCRDYAGLRGSEVHVTQCHVRNRPQQLMPFLS